MEGGSIFEHINPPQPNHPQNPPLAHEPLRPRTIGEYSRPSHQGYRNTIELTGANVLPLRSDTIRLVQRGCAFHGLRSEDPNQHLKDFLKIVDSIDLMLQLKSRPDYVYSNSLYVIKLVNGLNVYPRDPSPHGMISLLVSLLNLSHRGELPSLEMAS